MLARMTSDVAAYIHGLNSNLCVGTGAPQGYSSNTTHGAAGYMNGFLSQITNKADIDWIGFHGHIGDAAPSTARPPNLQSVNLSNIQMVLNLISGQPYRGKPLIDTEFAVDSGGVNDLPDANGANLAQFVAQDLLMQHAYVGYNNPVIGTMWYNPDDLGCNAAPCPDIGFYTDSSLSALNAAGQYWNEVAKWIIGKRALGPCSSRGTQWTCGFASPSGAKYLAAWDTGSGSTFNTGYYPKYTDINDNVVFVGYFKPIQLTRTPIFLAQY
jgi:hypothetical protein